MSDPKNMLCGLMSLVLFAATGCTESEPVSDCLGKTCNDQIGCTVDVCDEDTGDCLYTPDDSLCGPAGLCDPETGCVARPCEDDSDCDDYRFCNGMESCSGGECREGEAPCDDGFSCTLDSCDEQEESCQNQPDDDQCQSDQVCDPQAGDPVTGCRDKISCQDDQDCDDGVFCNGEEKCLEGFCNPGTPVMCDDQIDCTADSCSPGSDACLHLPDHDFCPAGQLCVPGQGGCQAVSCENSTECDDGYYCNGEETCQAGACQIGTAITCDDGIDCTFDACDEVADGCAFRPDHDRCNPGQVCDPEQGGCVVPPCTDDGDCQDGLYCNGQEVCDAGTCLPGTPVDCSDTVECTRDRCNEDNQECDHLPDHALCESTELCDPVDGCQSVTCQNDSDCDDGLICNGVEHCDAGSCAGGTPPDCDDSVACTEDVCIEEDGSCEHLPDDSACDDGTFCNGAEACDAVSGCQAGVDPCDDGVGCTVDSCDESSDSCQNVPDHTVCDDGVDCNGDEVCDPVEGCVQGINPCDDGVDCTDDDCDPTSGACINTPNNSNCDDGLYCNGAETCDAELDCQDGPAPDCDDGVACSQDQCDEGNNRCDNQPDDELCDDGNPCTQDSCSMLSEPSGCVYVAVDNGSDCSDGNLCNGLEQCQGGLCQAGTPLICTDDNPCTDNYCEPEEGCVEAPLSDGTPCPDGDLCNGDEVCQNGTCMPGQDLDCQDGNPCTDDGCFATEGCVNFDNADSCDDGEICTVLDRCVQGVCTGVTMEICGDGLDNDCDNQADEPEDCPGDIGTFVAPYGDDGNPGTQDFPLQTISMGIQNALYIQANSGGNPQDVFVAGNDNHTYYEDLEMAPGVSVWGGYSTDGSWTRDPATHVTYLQPSTVNGVKFLSPIIDRDTILDGFAIYGLYSLIGTAQTNAVTIDGCSPTVSNNWVSSQSAPNCTAIGVYDGADPLITGNSLETDACRASNRVLVIDNASAEVKLNLIEGGGGTLLFGVAMYTPGTVSLTSNTIRGGDAGGLVNITEATAVGVHVWGGADSVTMEYNSITGGTADGPSARVFGVNLEECQNSSVDIVNNPLIRGGQSYPGVFGQGFGFGIRAIHGCHANIQGNLYIRGGRGASESGYGIRCNNSSHCTVVGNGLILGAEPDDPVSQYAAGIYCEINSCQTITGNAMISGGSAPRIRGVVVDMGSSPVVDRNHIYAGRCARYSESAEGIGMLIIGGGSQVTNNVIFGGFCPLSLGIQQQNQASSGTNPQQLNVNGNYINGGGTPDTGGSAYGVAILVSQDGFAQPHGAYRNNIINAGLSLNRYGIWEGSAAADPVAVDFNDIVGATQAMYLDEGFHSLISIGQINSLADMETGSNISVYPGLVNEAPGGDFHLNSDSPCLDAGTSQGAPDHDMDDQPRPSGQAVDIGADEWQ